jgi:hypothetical protein
MMRFSNYALAFLAAAALGACAGSKSSPIVQKGNPPDWVNRGNGAFKDQTGNKVIYGVGILQGVRNIGLAVPQCDDRGRGEIAKVLNSMVTVLGKDYAASTTAGDMTKSSEEQLVSQTQKVFSQFTLHGSMPVDHWVDRSDKSNPIYYSLVKLDMAAVQASLAESKDLDSKVRDYVKANAEKAFDELNAEEAKH